jgi:hypothetical protein
LLRAAPEQREFGEQLCTTGFEEDGRCPPFGVLDILLDTLPHCSWSSLDRLQQLRKATSV